MDINEKTPRPEGQSEGSKPREVLPYDVPEEE